MRTQGQRQNYNWRPNDYSSTTLTRYDMEAEHWTKAFRNAASNHRGADIGGSIGSIVSIIDLFLSLVLTLIILIINGIISVIGMFMSRNNDDKRVSRTDDDILSDSECVKMYSDESKLEKIDLYDEALYE